MLRIGISVLAALCALLVCGQISGQERNATDAQGRKQGAWVKTWPETGNLRYTGQFKDDKPLGRFQYYGKDGVLTTVMDFKPGGTNASSKHFHPNGEIMAKGNYIDQLKDSIWHYFDEQGGIRKVECFDMGRMHGEFITYYKDGNISDKRSFNNSLPVGEWTEFHPNGEKRAQGTYNTEGNADGPVFYWFDNGRPEIKGKFEDGKRQGGWKYYNKDGTLHMQVLYDQGEYVKSTKENGVFKDLYEDEQIKNEVTWKNGKKEGRFVEYFNNGLWEERITEPDHQLGIEGGEKELVLSGQTVRMEGTFKNDQLHGVIKTYNDKGKLIKEENYIEGVLQ